jgi:hypothetical protein
VLREFLERCIGYTLVAGFIFGLFLAVTIPFEMLQMAAARDWPSQKGIVTKSSEVLKVSWLRSPYWEAEICGVYKEVPGGFCVARVSFGEFRFGDGRDKSREVVAKYPVGSEVDVYYSPTDPKLTILDPYASRSFMSFVFGLGIGLLLLPMLVSVLRQALAP